MTAYTYILECADRTLYTGWTNDLKKRLAAHNAGQGAKYTRGRGPVRLVYYEAFSTKEEAQKRETALKRLSRAAKLSLIKSGRTMKKRDEEALSAVGREVSRA